MKMSTNDKGTILSMLIEGLTQQRALVELLEMNGSFAEDERKTFNVMRRSADKLFIEWNCLMPEQFHEYTDNPPCNIFQINGKRL